MNEKRLMELGYITEEESEFSEPVTVSGYYQGRNGFYYSVSWNNGFCSVSKTGYSEKYLRLEREAESLYYRYGDECSDYFNNLLEKDIDTLGIAERI